MKKWLSLMLIFAATALADGPVAGPVSPAKAAELALHRIENLVTRKKIDEGFLHRFGGLRVTVINASAAEGEAKFEILGEQVKAADGSARRVRIQLDPMGFPVKYAQEANSPEPIAPAWPDKDPVTLSEGAMHLILDDYETKPELLPFFRAFTEMEILPGKNLQGSDCAKVRVKNSESAAILTFTVRLTGEIEDFQIGSSLR